ncbi:unnamed protein product [Rotaria sp. Silwood1]|nr:unnamed protein product [Rotaria sp. Silwood1]CAF3698732.1 unnamed protein product [Rotaria sp. Silwood1]CAF5025674.1 unnamed protein product [Rotaria sp. Silwood1]
MPLNRSLPEILAYGNSKEFPTHLEHMHNSAYDAALLLMQNADYVSAMLLIESILRSSEPIKFLQLKSSLKVKFHLILGHCYLKLEQNNEAMKFYEFALEQKNHLSSDNYMELLIGMGKLMEMMGRHEEALYKYIEAAELHENYSNGGTIEEHQEIEEYIK